MPLRAARHGTVARSLMCRTRTVPCMLGARDYGARSGPLRSLRRGQPAATDAALSAAHELQSGASQCSTGQYTGSRNRASNARAAAHYPSVQSRAAFVSYFGSRRPRVRISPSRPMNVRVLCFRPSGDGGRGGLVGGLSGPGFTGVIPCLTRKMSGVRVPLHPPYNPWSEATEPIVHPPTGLGGE